MKTAIITYDLKNVQPHDNILVKAELAKFTNTHTSVVSDNLLYAFPEWVRMSFPDTMLIAIVGDSCTTESLLADTIRIIHSVGAEPDKVYVAFIDPTTDLLWNSQKDRLPIC